jgi:hypothetical protein
MKNRYRQVKQMKFYESVKDALPHFLTAWIFRKNGGKYSRNFDYFQLGSNQGLKTLMLKSWNWFLFRHTALKQSKY